MYEPLNLPAFKPRIRENDSGAAEIFDTTRRKFVLLTPEEWVRQHFVNYMITTLGIPGSLIVVEAAIRYNKMTRRFDILAYTRDGKPAIIVECKAPGVKISQSVFDQAAMYNVTLKVDYLAVTNGITHYACKLNHHARTWQFLDSLPPFTQL